MRFISLSALVAGLVGAGTVIFAVATSAVTANETSAANQPVQAASAPAKLTIDYPADGSIFPPEITPPTFLWHEDSESATRWVIEVRFADHSTPLRIDAAGEHQTMGEIDPEAGTGDHMIPLTPEQAAMRTWKPDDQTWARIKQHSVKAPATIRIEGFADTGASQPVSAGSVTLTTSTDPVGAPVFYRDVPLMISPPAANGAIQPLPTSALPLIKWKLRNIGQSESHTVMTNLPTCMNCHSFSPDGKTMGIDLDGPKNDKGLYAIVPVSKQMVIGNKDTIRWSAFQEDLNAKTLAPSVKRFGFMSQISPDGRYVVTTIGAPKLGNSHDKEHPQFTAGLSNRMFSTNYHHLDFTQVFYPMRGILAWYDRDEKKLKPLPGADDPNLVQACAFWSPDGEYLIFSRAVAKDPYPANGERPTYANDPREPQIQYDLYRIPFNHGLGGKAEPIVGASHNGMSNDFPKVSPDGKWIVFVENHNGLLMRPDSKLYIVPFAGGKARLMRCNLWRMNSWHTFSPNGRWLAFSSKARSPYTQLMLTRIDAKGNDSPAILVENTTAANRAVNIPEFVNIPEDGPDPGIEKIDPQATEFYRVADEAYEQMEGDRIPEAVELFRKAIALDPEDAGAHFAMATALSKVGQVHEATEQYQKACVLDPNNAEWLASLAISLAVNGDMDAAIESWHKSLAIDPANAEVESMLGAALFQSGKQDDGIATLRKAVAMDPKLASAHKELGLSLSQLGQMDEAVGELQTATDLKPDSAEYRFNLGFVLSVKGELSEAIDSLKTAVTMSGGKDWRFLAVLAGTYEKSGRPTDAAQTVQQALDVAVAQHDDQAAAQLRGALAHYQQEQAQPPSQ
ncbi:MAG: tetratricopeptide repeat protein [Terracidiphilus sp.]